MRLISFLLLMTLTLPLSAQKKESMARPVDDEFIVQADQFADVRILRYKVPGFEKLTPKQRILIYYLSQAALCGRDMIWDQNYKHNLLIRHTLESLYTNYTGDRESRSFLDFTTYLKRVWFCNGIHHHYSTDKIIPSFSKEFFQTMVTNVKPDSLPLAKGQTVEQFLAEVTPLIFDPAVAPKRVSLDPSSDLIKASACNFYDQVSQKDAETYYDGVKERARKGKGDTLISFGLNSRLCKAKGIVYEKVYKSGGLYSGAIDPIIGWLTKAQGVAENSEQKEVIGKLIKYYKSGSLKTWDEYNIAWVKDLNSLVDFINGFIEVYGDPMAMKGSWESVVNFKNVEATRRTEMLSRNAQYFEDHSPVNDEFKKKEVKGVTAKVITVAQLGGDSYPATPIGINLPNANWIRKEYGSKSVTMDNITYAYDQSSKNSGFLEEFAASQEEIKRVRQYGYLAGSLTTDLHECLGHGSGQLRPGVGADALKNYHSTIEESRADLFALYYIMDPKMIELGLCPNDEVAKAEYDTYIRNGLMTQLVRIEPGKNIEESHMRDRALIARWVYEHGRENQVIVEEHRDGKTYYRITHYGALRKLFGELLAEIQRITSEGDLDAASNLVENYAVKVDISLHKEVLDRYSKLNIAPYAGFINPEYRPVEKNGVITDVKIIYPGNYEKQMMQYSHNYSFLPVR